MGKGDGVDNFADDGELIISLDALIVCFWHGGAVVITTAQLHSMKPELRFCTGSNPTCGVLEICNGKNF